MPCLERCAVDASPSTFRMIKIDGLLNRKVSFASGVFHRLVLFNSELVHPLHPTGLPRCSFGLMGMVDIYDINSQYHYSSSSQLRECLLSGFPNYLCRSTKDVEVAMADVGDIRERCLNRQILFNRTVLIGKDLSGVVEGRAYYII